MPPTRAASADYSRWCGAMEVHRRLLDQNPEYAGNRSLIENSAADYEAGEKTARRGVTDIPVVVHVVHNTPEQDIGDAQIISQIDVLNQDFRIHLATRDPLGQPTNGITRTSTPLQDFDTDDAVKFSLSGGQDAWPADSYLNIWVCQLRSGLLGYAQFPGGAAATDGVVITHSGFGTTGTAAAPFNGGRTATHEIGHWLNLRHIWGDDGEGCTGDDFVADTPNQGGPNTGAPSFPQTSCNNAPNGDMFMNYMDYTDDVAMFMFTAGQVARMDAILDNARLPLTGQAVRA